MNIEKLNEFLNNDKLILDIPVLPLNIVQIHIEKLGFEHLPELFEINGWDCDFCMYFEKNDYPYKLIVVGSLYYGNYSIYKGDK